MNALQPSPLRGAEWLERIPQGDLAARGVVLRRKEDAGGSQELLLFLGGLGAMWVLAPRASGARSRFGAGTEPMSWGEFRLYRSPRRVYLKSADVREGFWRVRKSPKTLAVAARWLKALADRLPPGHENDPLLSLLWGCLQNLSTGVDSHLLDVRFFWRWCHLWGLAPQLDRCSSCGADVASNPPHVLYLSPDGLLCPACRGDDPGAGRLSGSLLQELLHAAMLSRGRFRAWAASRTPDDPAAVRACSDWLCSFLSLL